MESLRLYLSLIFSLVIHASVFYLLIFIIDLQSEKQMANTEYVEMITKQFLPFEKQNESRADNLKSSDGNFLNKDSDYKEAERSHYFSLTEENSDTTMLDQFYSERTLDVSVKYPIGWTYIDSNVKNKLDGVSFCAISSDITPPPYVHIEVKEKYLFPQNKFQFNINFGEFIAYYNNPVELEGIVSQVVYIRTETETDFSFKLIVQSREHFMLFQPKFFGMIKSLKFRREIF